MAITTPVVPPCYYPSGATRVGAGTGAWFADAVSMKSQYSKLKSIRSALTRLRIEIRHFSPYTIFPTRYENKPIVRALSPLRKCARVITLPAHRVEPAQNIKRKVLPFVLPHLC